MSVSSLSTALSGLKAAQQSINTVSTNIANASTPGYTRKILPQESQLSADGNGLGVSLNNIIRKVDMNILKDVFNQTSKTQQFGTRASYLERIQQFHGPSEAQNAISSELGRLNDSFAALSVSPEDPALQTSTLNQARITAEKFNDMAELITQLRNEAQNELNTVVRETNGLLEDIRDLNEEILRASSGGRSVAHLLDKRDESMRQLSQNIEVSFYRSENDTIVVLGKGGRTLVDGGARVLDFKPTPLGAESSLGNGGATRLTITGSTSESDQDITSEAVGGKIEALLKLRDETLVQYQAQADELAQKTAMRFAEQGLSLFVNGVGDVPDHVDPPATVDYTGFAGQMQVNSNVLADPSLLQKGTDPGTTILPGSNEIIDRVLEFTFGKNSSYQSVGDVDIGAGTIFAATGLQQSAQVVGNRDLTDYAQLTDHADISDGMTFDVDIGAGAVTVTINDGDTAGDLVNKINAATGATTARLNGLGQLVFENNADITISDNTLGVNGAAALGISYGTTTAQNPSFNVQVGNQSPVTVSVAPTDTQTELLAKLNAIPGIQATLDGNGFLNLSSLDDNGINNGRITLTNGQGNAVAALGMKTSAVLHTAFRSQNLGIDGNVSTNMTSGSGITHYAKSMVALHAEEHATASDRADREEVFFNTLNESFLNETGVDIDQEMSDLIRFQTSYTAMTQLIQAAEKQFDDLINAIR